MKIKKKDTAPKAERAKAIDSFEVTKTSVKARGMYAVGVTVVALTALGALYLILHEQKVMRNQASAVPTVSVSTSGNNSPAIGEAKNVSITYGKEGK